MRRSDKLCYYLEGSNDAYTLARPLFGASERAFLIGRVKVRLGADAGEILLTLNCGAVRVCWPSATSPRTPVHAATYTGGFGLQGAPPQGQRDLAVRINVLYDACRRSAGARVISRRRWLCRLRQATPRSRPSARNRSVLHGHCSLPPWSARAR
jgi:hypothetical protein